MASMSLDELSSQARKLMAFDVLARRYTKRVHEVQYGDDYANQMHKPIVAAGVIHMHRGMVEMLKSVDSHVPLDYEMLERFDADNLCRALNQLLENISSTGYIKNGFTAEWLA